MFDNPLLHGRQLYDPGFEGWGHSPAGYITDYAITLVCVACAGLLRCRITVNVGLPAKHFYACAGFNGIAFFGGGVAHHLLDTYYRDGTPMGLEWGAERSGWLYPWLLTSLSAVGASAMAAVVLAFSTVTTQAKRVGFYVLYGLAALIVVYELYVLYEPDTTSTGTVTAYYCLLVSFVATVMAAADLACTSMRGGRLMLLLAASGFFSAFAFVSVATPGSCRKVGDEREGCPFPEAFNHNAIFHIIVLLSIVFLFRGVVSREEIDHKDDCLTEDSGTEDETFSNE